MASQATIEKEAILDQTEAAAKAALVNGPIEESGSSQTDKASTTAADNPAFDQQSTGYESCNWPRDITEAYDRPPGPYTVARVWALLDEEPLELCNGWLVWEAMTDIEERAIAANFQEILSFAAREAGFGQGLPDQAECKMSNNKVFKPDTSLISWERLKNDLVTTGRKRHKMLRGGPELVVEIRSPSNSRPKDRRKRADYFANGVQLIWDVIVEERAILVYRLDSQDDPQRFGPDDIIDCEPLLPGWRRQVADLFREALSAKEIAGETATTWHNEGRLDGMRSLVMAQASQRFGNTLPSDLESRLQTLDESQLLALATNLANVSTIKDWLASFPPK